MAQIIDEIKKRVTSHRIRKLLTLSFLGFLGPGLIATAAGNDAGGVATYSIAGADFGLQILWVMLPLTFGFLVIQEMSARLGAVTGKGFSDLVRENFSLKWTVFMMVLLTLANASLVVSEFAGIAASLELFGITKYISVPVAAIFIWFLIAKGNYPKAERIFLLMGAILISYIPAVFLAHPNWHMVLTSFVKPQIHLSYPYFGVIIALIGTTISPYIQIFAQSSVVEKGVTMADFKMQRLDTIFGVIFSNLISIFMIIATASTLFPAGLHIATATDAAQALAPFAGSFATVLFGVGFLGASLLAAGVLPVTTSFSLANAFGWEAGLNRSVEEAPLFYAVFTFLIVLAATIVLSPAISLIELLLKLQILNALVLPIELVFMIKLMNNHSLMGKYMSSKLFNILAWTTTIILSVASVSYAGLAAFNYLERILHSLF